MDCRGAQGESDVIAERAVKKTRKALDLMCGIGGMAAGLKRAGYHTGVDLVRPTSYGGDVFIQGDAFAFPLDGYDLIHASPKCQFATAYKRRPGHVKPSENQIPQIRARLGLQFLDQGTPYIIEQPEGSRGHMDAPILLCGSMFPETIALRRHRLFETSFRVPFKECYHQGQQGSYPQATNRANRRKTMEIGARRIPLAHQKTAMCIDWPCTLHELSQSIPPAYGEYIASFAP